MPGNLGLSAGNKKGILEEVARAITPRVVLMGELVKRRNYLGEISRMPLNCHKDPRENSELAENLRRVLQGFLKVPELSRQMVSTHSVISVTSPQDEIKRDMLQ